MIRNYITVALRNLWKNKVFSVINVAGLALGMACSLLILLWVQDENSMDAFHSKGSRLYRVYERQFFDSKVTGQYYAQGLLARELKREIPEIEMASPYNYADIHSISVGDKVINEKVVAADTDFFSMFDYSLLEGTPRLALPGMDGMAISRTMAVNFFGSPGAAMGKTLRYDNRKDFKVTAVFEDLSRHVSEHFELVVNWDWWLKDNEYLTYWDNNDPFTNILLRPDADPARVEKKMTHFVDKFMVGRDSGFRMEFGIQPFNQVYLNSHFTDGKVDGGRIEYVRLFSLVALFILLIACINFMNLTTARSAKRAREIGIRKVIGAVRILLIRQFMGEAILIAFLSALLALALVVVALPFFNELTGKQIVLPIDQWKFWAVFIGLTLVTGILSGSYPSLFLSSLNPIRVLKGSGLRMVNGAVWFRKGLVVFQFVLSIVLVIATIMIARQIRYVQDANLGYNNENLVAVPMDGDLNNNKGELFSKEALALPGVEAVSLMSQGPANVGNGTIGVQWPGKDPNAKPMFTQLSVGYDFTKTMGIRLLQGRDFSRDFPTDTAAYILNEEAVRKIGYKDPIGQPLTFWGTPGKIVGVVQDFHFQSLQEPIKALIIRLQDVTHPYGSLLVKTRGAQTQAAVDGLQRLYRELNPKFLFTYQFAREEYIKLYKSEKIVGRLSMIFALLAIFISCLGLLGLSMFTAEQRTKEIGIRKVLGAGMPALFNLLSREFLVLVGVAFAIATPLAWWGMNQWLSGFAYHTEISWWIFALSGIMAIVIALATVAFQALRVASANPIKSLRTE
jgi:putative ABC transport system permease protein